MAVKIHDRLYVDGPDRDGEYELTLSQCEDGVETTYLNRAEADALIDALSVRDASGRLIAPPQSQPAERPAGPWDANERREP